MEHTMTLSKTGRPGYPWVVAETNTDGTSRVLRFRRKRSAVRFIADRKFIVASRGR